MKPKANALAKLIGVSARHVRRLRAVNDPRVIEAERAWQEAQTAELVISAHDIRAAVRWHRAQERRQARRTK